ncbi:MAG: 3'(2'),5'-bisphosphate nucleotidase CysQ [Lachnospiraceae bacterium]|nr:3'(2'),5'-bisphosphate nucleotidase CysQ [Lachnospiraceae bacterium]
MSWNKELSVSKIAAYLAGKEINKIYERDFDIEYKNDNSPLTEADMVANKIIVEMLRREFPTYAILSEEEKDNKKRLENDYCFIVDPLDGTKEFIKRNGQFTVNIALAYKHRTVMGVIYVPVTGEMYYAAQGEGAWVSDKNGQIKKLHVSDTINIEEIRLVMSSSHTCEQMEELIKKYHFNNFVKMGSSLKGCLVAKGDAEVYYRYNPTMEWDTAAMQCIAAEAGAIVRQMDDSELLYNRENSLNDKGFYIINRMENRI